MSLFKNRKLNTIVVEVQGESFTLTEPSALNMCHYWEMVEKEHLTVNDDSTKMFKAQVNAKCGLMLTAVCMGSQFPDKSTDDIYKMLCEEVVDYSDVNKFVDAAEEVANLKIEPTDLQDGSSPTD